MRWRVDPSHAGPIFQQIVQLVVRGVATGRLAVGEKLPSVRDLARELVINPNTIAKAYRELEADGVVESRRGSGTFVAPRRVVFKSDERRRRFRAALEVALLEAVSLGLTPREVDEAYKSLRKRLRLVEVKK